MSQPTPEAKTWPPAPASNLSEAEDPSTAPRGSLGRSLIFIAYAVFITTMAQDMEKLEV